MNKKQNIALLGLCAALAACGGGGSGDNDTVGSDPAPGAETGFTTDAQWQVVLPAAGEAVCYDFDTQTEVAGCDNAQWDIKLVSGGRSASLATNSGPSGVGNGGAFGSPFEHTWSELLGWANAQTDPVGGAVTDRLYFADTARSVFTGDNAIQSTAFEYALTGGEDRQLYPTYRVHLITTDSASAEVVGTAAAPVFALQITGYYGGATGTESGHVSFQWIDRAAPASLRQASVDATEDWAYFDLISGTETSASGNWQIAFNRYNVKLNGGESGSGSVGGYLARTPDGMYTAEGAPIVAAFVAATPQAMAAQMQQALDTPASARNWVVDEISSQLQPEYQGSYPAALNFGFYSYFPTADAAQAAGLSATAHLLAANPTQGTIVRSGEGDSYARMHLLQIDYADPADSASQQTWTFELDVQPATTN